MPWFGACCARSPGLRHLAAVAAWHLSVCLGCGRLRALFGAVALGAPIGFPDAVVPFPTSEACAPGFTGWLRGARGGRPRTGLIVPAAGPRQGRDSGLTPRGTRSGPRNGVIPGGSLRRRSWAAWAAVVGVCGPGHGVWFPVSSVVRRGTQPVHQGCFVWTPTPPLAGQRTPRSGPVRACVCSSILAGSDGPAPRARSGVPHLFLWPLCLSALLGSLRAGFAPVLVLCFSVVSSFAFFCFFFVSLLFFSFRPLLSLAFFGFRPQGALGPGALCCFFCWPCASWLSVRSRLLCVAWPLAALRWSPPPLSLAVVAVPSCLALFFSSCVRPLVSGFLCFPAPGASGLGAGLCLLCSALRALCCFFFLPLGSSCALAPFVSPGWPLVAAPPPSCVSRFSLFSLGAFVFFSLLLCAPVVSGFLWFPAPGALGLGAVFCLFVSASRCPALRARLPRLCLRLGRRLLPRGCCPPPPSPFVSPRFRRSCSVPCFYFFLLCAPPLSPAFSGFWPRVPWTSALCVVCFVGLPLLGSPCALASFVLSAWPLASPWWLLPPPPSFVCRGFRCCRSVLFAVCCAVLCVPGCGAAPRCCALCRPVLCSRVLCCFVAPLWCRCLLCHALWRCPSPWGPVLCGAVFCGVPPCCVLCAVCVLSWRGGACCCLPLCFVLCVSRGAVLCVPCFLCPVRCCASLCWCACVVLFWWCVLLLAPGAVVCCWVLCFFFWCAVVRCCVWWPVVVCRWRVTVSVSLSDRVVCFPVAGVVCCGALLPCVVCCGAVLSRGAVLLCSAVVLRCCWGLFCPSVACRAVLCCAVCWLCCFLPGGGVCVLWCSFPRAVRSLSSPLCALRCLVVLAVVPCFPVSCAVALCCHVVLCCRALLSFCGAVFVCSALLWPVVRCRAVLCCAVGCLCCFLPGGGVCVLWCPFPPCRHAQKTSVILHVTPRWWRCCGWLALLVAVSWTRGRVRSTCSEREAKAWRVGHGREGKVHGDSKRA